MKKARQNRHFARHVCEDDHQPEVWMTRSSPGKERNPAIWAGREKQSREKKTHGQIPLQFDSSVSFWGHQWYHKINIATNMKWCNYTYDCPNLDITWKFMTCRADKAKVISGLRPWKVTDVASLFSNLSLNSGLVFKVWGEGVMFMVC